MRFKEKRKTKYRERLFIVLLSFCLLGIYVGLQESYDEEREAYLSQPVSFHQRRLLSDRESPARDGRNFFGLQGRKNWASDSVPDEFCCFDYTTNTCDWSNYAQSLSLLAVAPFVIGMVMLFFFPLLFILRIVLVRCSPCYIRWRFNTVEKIVLRVFIIVVCVCIS
jgi:hypothetical protein